MLSNLIYATLSLNLIATVNGHAAEPEVTYTIQKLYHLLKLPQDKGCLKQPCSDQLEQSIAA